MTGQSAGRRMAGRGRVPSAGAASPAERIERLVARAHRVALSELTAPGRPSARVARARHMAMYLQRVVLELSCDEIGRRFAHHRTSVIHACRKIEDRRDDAVFDSCMERLEARIALELGRIAR